MAPRFSATGIISGFSEVDTDQGNTQEQLTPTHFSLEDAKRRIEEIRANFNPEFLDALIIRVLGHIQNFNNPHHVTLSQTSVDVITLVYDTWLSLGNTGSLEDFYTVFYQIMPIASQDDIAGGTSTNLVPVSGVTTMIETHNTDPNAHQALIDLILPGTPPKVLPDIAFDIRVGVPVTAVMDCPSGYNVIDRAGNLSAVAGNTIGIDYSTGEALIPLYGFRENQFHPSSPLVDTTATLMGATMASSATPVGTLQFGPDGAVCAILTESINNEIHGYYIPMDEGLLTDNEYTTSVFVYPLNRTGGISLTIDTMAGIAMMLNLVDYSFTTRSGVVGYVQPLNNGWVRIGMQYVSNASVTATLQITKTATAVLGDPAIYHGAAAPMFGLFGLSQVIGSGMSPYIASADISNFNDAANLTMSANLDNGTNGLIGMRYNKPASIRTWFNRGVVTFGAGITITDSGGNLFALPHNTDTSSGPPLTLASEYNQLVTTAFSYAPDLIKLGTSGLAKISTAGPIVNLAAGTLSIVFGTTDVPFDGGLQSLTVYPVSDTNEEIEFVIGEVHV